MGALFILRCGGRDRGGYDILVLSYFVVSHSQSLYLGG